MTGSKQSLFSGPPPRQPKAGPPPGAAGPAGAAGEAQLRLLTDALPQMVWTLQADGRATYFNQRWLDYSGSSLQESLGPGWRQWIHPEDGVQVPQLWQPDCGSDGLHEIELRLRRADGVYRWMLGRTVAQRDSAGRITQWLGTLTDIDALKQTQKRLEKNLSMKRVAGRVARLGGWTIELPERTLAWSDENCLIHDLPPGYQLTLEEGIGYFFPAHRPIVARHVQDCIEHGLSYEFVLPKRTATGRHIWVRSIGEAVRDASGKIIRIQGAFQDITEQKAAEARMLALEARLITTLESITDGFCLIDKDWTFTFLNSQAERMLKRGPEDLLGQTLWQAFPETVGTRIERACRLAVQNQRTGRLEAFYLPLQTWFHFHIYPTEAGLAVYFQDITERRAEQAQLRLLETAVARVNDIVVIAKAEGSGGGEGQAPGIVFVNDAFTRQTGYGLQDMLGKTTGLLWGAQPGQPELARVKAAMENWQAVRAEIIVHTRDGQARWLETDIAPIANEWGKFTHWVAVKRDITERRQQQQEILSLNSDLEARVLVRTAQLAAVNQELASFAYSVSHDLRSPLSTIHAFSQLLLKKDSERLSDKGQHYLGRIGVAVKQMGELIEGLLALARLSREPIHAEQVDLTALVRRIEQDYREREPQRQAQLRVQDGLSTHGDARLLAALFHNLLSNAWKFTSRRALAQIEVGSEPGADGASVFFVRDNGAGFDMAFAHKLFGTFERLHSPGDFSGTGIGLATVKRIVERHGGRIWAQGQLNEGAVFFFTLGAA